MEVLAVQRSKLEKADYQTHTQGELKRRTCGSVDLKHRIAYFRVCILVYLKVLVILNSVRLTKSLHSSQIRHFPD